jgi:hypothetical protein
VTVAIKAISLKTQRAHARKELVQPCPRTPPPTQNPRTSPLSGELRNLVAKVAMESQAPEIDFSRLSAALTGEPTALRQTASLPVGNLESMEEQMILKALERTGGHRMQAAEQLGISRRTLSRKLKEYSICFEPGENTVPLGFVSTEQQKFFRARVEIPVTIKNVRGEELAVQGVNLSTGGMGLDGLK